MRWNTTVLGNFIKDQKNVNIKMNNYQPTPSLADLIVKKTKSLN